MPKIASVFAEVLGSGTQLVSAEVGKRMVLLLHSLQAGGALPPDIVQVTQGGGGGGRVLG